MAASTGAASAFLARLTEATPSQYAEPNARSVRNSWAFCRSLLVLGPDAAEFGSGATDTCNGLLAVRHLPRLNALQTAPLAVDQFRPQLCEFFHRSIASKATHFTLPVLCIITSYFLHSLSPLSLSLGHTLISILAVHLLQGCAA